SPASAAFPSRRSSDLAVAVLVGGEPVLIDTKALALLLGKRLGLVADRVGVVLARVGFAVDLFGRLLVQIGAHHQFVDLICDEIRSEEHTSELQSRENL